MFESNPYLKMFGFTALVIFATLLTLGIVLLENPPGFFGWFFGALSGASWGLWLNLLRCFLEREVPRD